MGQEEGGDVGIFSRGDERPQSVVLRTSVIAAIGGFLFGYDIGVISGALLYSTKEPGSRPLTRSWIVLTAGSSRGPALLSLDHRRLDGDRLEFGVGQVAGCTPDFLMGDDATGGEPAMRSAGCPHLAHGVPRSGSCQRDGSVTMTINSFRHIALPVIRVTGFWRWIANRSGRYTPAKLFWTGVVAVLFGG